MGNVSILHIKRDSQVILTDTIGDVSVYKLMDFAYNGYTGLLVGCGDLSIYPTSKLYLFDSANNVFIYVPGFFYYQSTHRLETDTAYYYSYSHAGCADNIWFSELFTIKNYKLIALGSIYGNACDEDSTKWGISIYKGNSEDTANHPIKQLPYIKYIPEFSQKWDFIKTYWNMNYREFLKP